MKKKIIIKKKFITFLLVYLVLFTSYFSMITLSKHIGIVRGSATTTIAKWEVSADTLDNTSDILNITIGNTQDSYTLKITSTSEVKAKYSIFLSNLPTDVQVKLDNGTYQTPVNNEITFIDVGYINANASSNDRTITHTLTFNVPIDSPSINASEINIDVIFNQVIPTSN